MFFETAVLKIFETLYDCGMIFDAALYHCAGGLTVVLSSKITSSQQDIVLELHHCLQVLTGLWHSFLQN